MIQKSRICNWIYDFRITNYDLKVMFLTVDQDFGSNNFIFALVEG